MAKTPRYNPKEIEPRWQKKWERDGLYNSDIDPDKTKYYALTMLPYPSGDLHIGHWYAMTPADARARFLRMRGFNVLFPIGFDAFGLPAENAAIQRGIHPKKWTYSNIEKMRTQIKSMGTMFDWRREATSADPEYYHWTEWFFLQLYNHGLAYRKKAAVDWCPKDNTTLAREQVVGDERLCERCGTPVIKKELEQWFFRITDYADELLDFSSLDWPERVRLLQTNWIGRSEGASVVFTTEDDKPLEVFTTRPDTLWGATFMVLAPEHPLVPALTSPDQKAAVEAYVTEAVRQTDIQRESLEKEKTGVFTGGYAINPVNGARIPVWIADYVLMSYGTGAIMAVPAHDERDFEFALKYGLPILPVIARPDGLTKSIARPGTEEMAAFEAKITENDFSYEREADEFFITISSDKLDRFLEIARDAVGDSGWATVVGSRWLFLVPGKTLTWESVEGEAEILKSINKVNPGSDSGRTVMEFLWSYPFIRDTLFHHEYGVMINSGPLTGTKAEEAFQQTIRYLESEGIGEGAVNYRLHDWLISRQRYWGAPIPMIHCQTCGVVPVPEYQLPVLLPDDVEWLPTGESPLKLHPTWRQTTCPICDEPAERETDTMDTFMCSSWYHLRYLSPHYDQGPFDPKEYDYWMPVDTYTGGIEHATMHLIYTRFFHKALRDMGITRGPEPMIQLRNQGIVLGEDSEKMSKSRGNVVAPDALVQKYGADTVRAYLMFFARWDQGGPWNSSGIEGCARWLRRVWSLFLSENGAVPTPPDPAVTRQLKRRVHQTLSQITSDMEQFEFNTIISALMELLNEMVKARDAGASNTPEWNDMIEIYLRMMAPVTPHTAEELWSRLGKPYSIHQQPWPEFDPLAATEEQVTLVVQVNGKLRDRIEVPAGISDEDARERALSSETIQRFLGGQNPQKVIVVPGRLVNIVI